MVATSIITSQVKTLELNQERSKKGTMMLPPGMISQSGNVPIHEKKYLAESERVAVVPLKIELDCLMSLGKSVFLISSTTIGTKKMEVISRAVIRARGIMIPKIKKNFVKKTKGSCPIMK